MKKIYLLILIAFVSFLSSCEKDPIVSDDKNVGISRITYYPTITLMGDDVIAIENGTSFADPGATATAAGADIPVTSGGSVDTDVDGVYVLTYSATNADGFASTATRFVVVYTTAPDAAAHDLSGTYLRPATGVPAIWTKIAPGVYRVFNPGGSPDQTLTVFVFNPEGFTIFIPEQVSNDGSITSSTDESYTNSDPPMYSWKIVNPTYGSALRTFVKQ